MAVICTKFGADVLVSRYFGARDYGKMKTIVSTSLISFLILSILLGVFGAALATLIAQGISAVFSLLIFFTGYVNEIIDFSTLPVNPCQNKRTENHLS